MPLDGTNFKPATLDEVTALLITARELVVQGWCQRSLMRDGKVCTIGALRRAYCLLGLRDSRLYNRALSHLARAIYGSDNPEGIVPWNDEKNPDGSPARTKDEVIAAYGRAIVASSMNETR